MVTIMTKELTGLIIRVIDYKESSLIVHLLTKEKVESVIAKGVKKINSKLKGYILSYNYVTMYVTDSKIPVLTDILVINQLENIQNNIRKNMYAGQIINMLYKEHYDNNRVYELALKTINYINDNDEEYYYNLFLLKNLHFIGLGLSNDLDKKNVIGFNILEGVIVSKEDNLSTDINKDDTIKIYELYYSKLEDKIEININMLHNFLVKYYELHASIKL